MNALTQYVCWTSLTRSYDLLPHFLLPMHRLTLKVILIYSFTLFTWDSSLFLGGYIIRNIITDVCNKEKLDQKAGNRSNDIFSQTNGIFLGFDDTFSVYHNCWFSLIHRQQHRPVLSYKNQSW